MSDIVVGIDAGGSKTRVIVATVDGEKLADVTGAGALMTPGDAENCALIIGSQIELALASAEAQYKPKIVYAGVAGTGREAERVSLQDAIANKDLAEEVRVTTDASVALVDAFGSKAGIILIAGSGSVAYGRSAAGQEMRCGGWGIAFGDEGSGAWIGRKALNVVAAAHDGREPTTALTGAILTAAQVNEPEELIPWAIAANKEMLAALAPTVVAVAKQDDLRANAIIDMAVEELLLHIRALAKRLFIDDRTAFDVAMTGGLLIKGSLIRRRLEKRIKASVLGANIKPEEVIGARGAVAMAIQALTGGELLTLDELVARKKKAEESVESELEDAEPEDTDNDSEIQEDEEAEVKENTVSDS